MHAISYVLRKMDILGDNFVLTQKSEERFTTKIGGCLTLISVTISIFVIGFFFYQFFQVNDPTIAISSFKATNYPKISYSDTKFTPFIHVRKNGQPLSNKENQRFFTFVMIQVTFNREQETSIESTQELYVSPMIPCGDDKTDLNDYMKQDVKTNLLVQGYSYCASPDKPEKYFSSSSAVNAPFSYITYGVFPCTLPDPSDCASGPEIDKTDLIFVYPETIVNGKDYKNPVTAQPNTDFKIAMDHQHRQMWSSSIRINKIMDETSEFFSAKQKATFLDFENTRLYTVSRDGTKMHCKPEEIIGPNCSAYALFDFLSGPTTQIITRKYVTIFQTLGNIGGIFELILAIVGVFYIYFKRRTKDNILREIIYKRSSKEYSDVLHDLKRNEILKKMSQQAKRQKDASHLLEKVGSYEVLESAIMKPYHRVLNPLVLMVEEINNEKNGNKSEKDENVISFKEAFKLLKKDNNLSEFQKLLSKRYYNVLRPIFGARGNLEAVENCTSLELSEQPNNSKRNTGILVPSKNSLKSKSKLI